MKEKIQHQYLSCNKLTVLVTKFLASCQYALDTLSVSPNLLMIFTCRLIIHRLFHEYSCIHFIGKNFSNLMKECEHLGIQLFIVLLM